VVVLAADEHDRTDEPMLSIPEKIVTFDDPMALKTVVDRMKGFDKFLTVTAFPKERLCLEVSTGIVHVATQFAGLDIVHTDRDNHSNDNDTEERAERRRQNDQVDKRPSIVRVDCKQLSQALGVAAIRHDSISFCLTTDYVLIVYIKLHNESGQFTLYLQSVEREEMMEEDEEEDGGGGGGGEQGEGDEGEEGEEGDDGEEGEEGDEGEQEFGEEDANVA